ncbi:SDR family oxidoreductase [Tumebacillus permanentifrigoris]|uniref:3-oxoacyl-[acyl-carrier protein] reductase n=1 Tax=Tumebacillus permanentifrigoris TaxID=378543 RepID=A0A316DDF1_9BACL|nr:SDR family oxidoreductase [Tumebacillus permanentifrigoris]PWK15716.1 3-oxoacyl-[acyl-carrier protein] reductase [Tumebacillus permanentifrigoris]
MLKKVALITGSSTGLGKRTALELAKQGIDVVINYRTNQEKALDLARELERDYSVRALAVRGDVSDAEDCRVLIEGVIEAFGRIDILINNAGPYIAARKKMADYELDEWNAMINGNLTSVFYLSKLVIPYMRQNGWGRIVNFGFDRADSAPAWMFRSAFAAAKVGLVSLTRTLALEEAEHGITVNMVCPGDITHEWKEANIADVHRITDAGTPVGRVGTGEDIARTIAFFCAEASDFITGTVLAVTGGKDVLTKYKFESEGSKGIWS